MLPNMIWEIEQIFARTPESVKIGTLIGTFCTKLKMYEIKIYRGVICHDKEEWCKNWRGIDLSIQNWHEEFDQFWHEHLKISNIFTLTDWFWPKYIMFELKKYRGVMFDGTEVWCKTWRKSNLCFQIWHEKLSQFWPEHLKVSKLGLCLTKVENVWAFSGKLCVMTMKNDAKIEEKLNCHFKIDMRNLTNFDLSTRKFQIFSL